MMFFFLSDSNKTINGDNYTVIDIETTPKSGTKVPIQIAALRVRDGEAQIPYTQDINPEYPISSWAKENVNLDDEYLATCPKIYEVIEEFINYIGDDVVVGANVKGSDITPINNQYYHYFHKSFDNDFIDITDFAKQLKEEGLLKIEQVNMETLLPLFGLGSVQHNALDDCYDEYYLFESLKQLKEGEDVILDYSKKTENKKNYAPSVTRHNYTISHFPDRLKNKRVCVSGLFDISVEEIERLLKENGCSIKNLSAKQKSCNIDFFIKGKPNPQWKDGIGNKTIGFNKLIAEGYDIEEISEEEFYEECGIVLLD